MLEWPGSRIGYFRSQFASTNLAMARSNPLGFYQTGANMLSTVLKSPVPTCGGWPGYVPGMASCSSVCSKMEYTSSSFNSPLASGTGRVMGGRSMRRATCATCENEWYGFLPSVANAAHAPPRRAPHAGWVDRREDRSVAPRGHPRQPSACPGLNSRFLPGTWAERVVRTVASR